MRLVRLLPPILLMLPLAACSGTSSETAPSTGESDSGLPDTSAPDIGGDASPADGRDAGPSDGGSDAEPSDGGSDAEPSDGGSDAEPSDGGSDAEPDAPEPTCTDVVKNGDESDVDCGGASCAPCEDGKTCAAGSDCASGVCEEGVCAAPSCTDEVKNGSETDVDCGGASCAPCGDGKACAAGSDCSSGVCEGGTCAAPTCTDSLKNGSETDVDCGGTCAACADGKSCVAGDDCASGVCSSGTCAAPSCTDSLKNGSETDVDCGGPSCGPCGDGKACGASSDCTSGVCSSGTCAAPSCTDSLKNGSETDVDCGGACAGCAIGKACASASDCAAGVCLGGACAHATTCNALHTANPALPSGVYTIDPDGPGGAAPFDAYCDMTSSGGGWTLVLKMDGAQTTFSYDAALWTNTTLLNETSNVLDTTQAKLRGYLSVPFTELRLGMIESGVTRWLDVAVPGGGASLHAVITTVGHVATSIGPAKWKTLLSSASLQANCNKEGLNAHQYFDQWARVRIGIITNQENDCETPDSWIGFGGYGAPCGGNPNLSCGNVAACSPDNGEKSTPAFGYVFVR